MVECLARCGYRCDLCLAYRPNVERLDEREYLSQNWKLYFDLEFPVERLVCDGCLDCRPDADRIDRSCPVRPCTMDKGLEHCGQCEEFACARFEARRGYSLEQARDAAGDRFSMAAYRRCVLPYDNHARLVALRMDPRRTGRLTNAAIAPKLTDMVRFIGEPAGELFAEVVSFLEGQGDLDVRIAYGGKRYEWEVGARKGSRPILSVTPLRGSFLVLCVMGKNEIGAYQADRALLSDGACRAIDETETLHDGKWVFLPVSDATGLRDAKALFAIKRFGRRAREKGAAGRDRSAPSA